MIPGGYILQPRLFDGSDASKMPPCTREVWFYILRNVNHADSDKYKRGQGFFNISDIRNDLCWYTGYRKNTYSKTQVAKAIRRLYEGNMVDTAKATRGLYITVCNYEYYQDPKNYEGHTEKTAKKLRRNLGGDTKNKKKKEQEEQKEEDILSDFKKNKPDAFIFSKDLTKWGTKEDAILAEFIFKKVKEKFKKTKNGKMPEWSNQIRLMRTVDKYTHKQIQDLFLWAHNDEFWSSNIRSTSKLRQKHEELEAKRQSGSNINYSSDNSEAKETQERLRAKLNS